AFTQRRVVAFPLVAVAELLVVFIGFGVWAHHMFATGMPTVTVVFFAAATAIVVIPSTIQVFAWCMTFVTGNAQFKTPLLFIAGFIFMFIAGGLTGIMFLAVPFDQQVTDTYFVIAHFHYIIFGAAVFPIFGGIYYWFPKVTGRMYAELPGQISFWIIFVGTNLLFFPMHVVGLLGMTRREYTYPSGLGWTIYNVLDRGHEQVAIRPVDGVLDEVVQMPHESPWPVLLALSLALVFSMLVIGRFGEAGIMGVLCLLALAGWHSTEPEEA